MRTRYLLALAALLLAVPAFIVACSTEDAPPPSTSGSADPGGEAQQPRRELPTDRTVTVNFADPEDVLTALCGIVYTRDAVAEASYSDSYRRALGLMTPEMGKPFQSPSSSRPLPQWVRWQNANAQVEGSCRIVPAVTAPDTERSVERVIYASQVVHYDDGSTEELADEVIYGTAVKGGDRWLVSAFDVQTFK